MHDLHLCDVAATELTRIIAPKPDMPENAIVFGDPGTDDAYMLSILMASSTEIEGIIASGGNVPLAQTVDNTLRICRLTGREDIPVYAGSAAPTGRSAPETDAVGAHGADGLGGVKLLPPRRKAESGSGVDFAAERIRQGAVTLISTGGLTDLYDTLTRLLPQGESEAAELAAQARMANIRAIYMMGGVFDPAEANAPNPAPEGGKFAEFNFLHDPIATRKVFAIAERYGIPIMLAPLDVTHQVVSEQADAAALRALANPVADMVAHFIENPGPWDVERYGRKAVPMHDVLAGMALLQPEFFQARSVHVAIDPEDTPTASRCRVTGTEGGNVHVLTVDPNHIEPLKAAFIERLRAYSADRALGSDCSRAN